MDNEKAKSLKINFLELAYIMDIEQEKAKEIFVKNVNRLVITESTLTPVYTLLDSFENITSLDKRYDGQNELLFNLMNKSHYYKRYLNDMGFIISGKFTGGKSILIKIMNKEQLIHLYSVKKIKYKEIINNGVINSEIWQKSL